MSKSAPEQPFLIFGSPLIEQAEIDEVVACMESAWLGTGPRVAQFERDFAAYQGLQPSQVAAVNSCTAALHVSMVASDLEPGSEVITTPMTFCASVNAIIHAGLTPVLADVDAETQNIDPAAIEAAITPRTQAILGAFRGTAVRDGCRHGDRKEARLEGDRGLRARHRDHLPRPQSRHLRRLRLLQLLCHQECRHRRRRHDYRPRRNARCARQGSRAAWDEQGCLAS